MVCAGDRTDECRWGACHIRRILLLARHVEDREGPTSQFGHHQLGMRLHFGSDAFGYSEIRI